MIRAITISGESACGTSSLAKAIITLLPEWSSTNTGQWIRDHCQTIAIPIQQADDLPDDIYRAFDITQQNIIQTKHRILIEGRLEVRIFRYMKREGCSRRKAVSDLMYRDRSDLEKYRRIYGLSDYRLPIYYDLMVNTATRSPTELARQILVEAHLVCQHFTSPSNTRERPEL